jgi:hypothetical protein
MNDRPRSPRPSLAATLIVVALALVMLFLWYGRRMSEAILPGMNSARTTSMEPADLLLRDPDDETELRLRIPKAYMTRAENWRGGAQQFIWIETALPQLQPAAAASSLNNGVYITLQNERADWAGDSARERWLKTYSVDRHSGSYVAYELVNQDEFGLTFYKSLACRPPEPAGANAVAEPQWQCHDSHREYYVSNEGDPVVHISCHAENTSGAGLERVGCQARTSFRGFTLSYVFRSTELSRWQEFDSAVRRLLGNFLVTDSRR